jgi:hypothetical protein
MAVSFIGEGNQITRRKPLTCHNFVFKTGVARLKGNNLMYLKFGLITGMASGKSGFIRGN